MVRIWVSLLLVLSCLVAAGDTLTLTTGVEVKGKVKQLPDGNYEVKVGDHTLIYQKVEIQTIVPNERDGSLNLEEIKAQEAAIQAELTQKTGLTTEQRRLVLDLVYKLKNPQSENYASARDRLVALQKEFNVFGFLMYMLPEFSHHLTPAVLEVLVRINPDQARKTLRSGLTNPYFGTRAKAIELLGNIHDSDSVAEVARGLADAMDEVKIQAAYALANLGARDTTPALIALLSNVDQRVANASKKALEALWAGQFPEKAPLTVEEWQKFWSTQSAQVGGIELASLQPLVPAAEEFQNE
ncbi:MAG: HEAT repeat domain-containing protein [Candidatus Hydrogenedentes bacterium]|nr:HEAT repeat domain-containing protein [Candidatus Hydrogenedentota bacterium]